MTDLVARSALERATRVADLVPVDADAAGAVARRLLTMAATLERAASELRGLEAAPEWKGDAGRAFEATIGHLPDDAQRGARVFEAAGRAFSLLAETVSTARPDVATAHDLWCLAREQSRRWHLEAEPIAPDPGEATADRAVAIYARARERMEDAAEQATRTLVAAAESAPGYRDLLPQQGAIDSIHSFGSGVGDFATDFAGFVYAFNPIRAAVDRDGFSTDVGHLAGGVEHLVRNPHEVDDVLLDLELLRDDPARWLGKILGPTILLAVASRVPSLAPGARTRAAERLGPVGRFAIDHAEEVSRFANGLGLPLNRSVAALTNPGTVQVALDSARRVERDRRELERFAREHGGEPDDYERRRAAIPVEGDRSITFEFVQNTQTGEVVDSQIVAGGPGERCDR